MECSNGYKLLPSSIYNNCSICKYVCLSFPYTRFPSTHPYPWQPYGQCVLPFAMYGGYCQLIIQLQPWIEKVFDFAISNFTWPLAEKRIENNKKGSDNQWIKRCYNGCNENQPYFFLHIYTLKLISFLELPSWKFGVFLFFFSVVFAWFLSWKFAIHLEVELAQAIFSLARAGRHEQEHESGWNLKKRIRFWPN